MDTEKEDERHMRAAIAASREAMQRGDMPFGAVLARDGRVLMAASNNQDTSHDCTGHAEIVLVRLAQRELGADVLKGATVYASGEPCAMCAGAMFWAGVTRVVYGASSPEMDAVLGGATLGARCEAVLANAHPAMAVEGPLLEAEAVEVIRAAMQARRVAG